MRPSLKVLNIEAAIDACRSLKDSKDSKDLKQSKQHKDSKESRQLRQLNQQHHSKDHDTKTKKNKVLKPSLPNPYSFHTFQQPSQREGDNYDDVEEPRRFISDNYYSVNSNFEYKSDLLVKHIDLDLKRLKSLSAYQLYKLTKKYQQSVNGFQFIKQSLSIRRNFWERFNRETKSIITQLPKGQRKGKYYDILPDFVPQQSPLGSTSKSLRTILIARTSPTHKKNPNFSWMEQEDNSHRQHKLQKLFLSHRKLIKSNILKARQTRRFLNYDLGHQRVDSDPINRAKIVLKQCQCSSKALRNLKQTAIKMPDKIDTAFRT